MDKYVKGPAVDKVCVVYGLRRTGKTTMLKQKMLSFTEEQLAHAAYIKARTTDVNAGEKFPDFAGLKFPV